MPPSDEPARPAQPVLIYDGDCGFCRSWIARWRQRTGTAVEYLPAQAAGERYPALAEPARREAVRYVAPDGAIAIGADAVARTLAHAARPPLWLLLWRFLPGLAWIARRVYGLIARHRTAAERVTRALWGGIPFAPTYVVAGWLFPRLVAATYAIAFASLWSQLPGLIGPTGLAPVGDAFAKAHERLGGETFARMPSLLWLHPTLGAAQGLCVAGVVAAVAAMIGLLQGWCLIALWAMYLSLMVAGGQFLSFQWDVLLLETGFLALGVAGWRWLAPLARARAPAPVARALLLFLLARLMIASGLVKLTSGDETWTGLTALRYHFETQPLPTRLGWWAHQASTGWQRFACGAMFAIELAAPLAMLGPRRLRLGAAAALAALQVAIAATGNYGFFNLLSLILCLPLIDDFAMPARLRRRAVDGIAVAFSGRRGWGTWVGGGVALAAAAVALVALLDRAVLRRPFAAASPAWCALDRCCAPARALGERLEPLRTINAYGLFEVMTHPRYELVVEGTRDGVDWKPYGFRWKPGDPRRAPGWVAPHMPRLDWQMWFAALSPSVSAHDAWVIALAQRLLEGSPEVIRLLAVDPFAGEPPRYVRVRRVAYRFTTPAERRETGAWWAVEPQGEAAWLPPLRLR